MDTSFFTLLYVQDDEAKRYQRKMYYSKERIILFLKCASLLRKSLNSHGWELSIITNKKSYLNELLCDFETDINVVEIEFSLNVPRDIYFYSAHFKIDAFKYISTLDPSGYYFLVDCDVVCMNEMPAPMRNCIAEGLPMHYVLPRFYLRKSLQAMQKICTNIKYGYWSGGEFISGKPQFFSDLYNKILTVKDNYFSVYKEIFEQGDEILTSVALDLMVSDSKYIIKEAGALGVVYRYWSISDNNIEKLNCWLVHLPYDKAFLAKTNDKMNNFNINQFYTLFRRNARRVFVIKIIKWGISLVASKKK